MAVEEKLTPADAAAWSKWLGKHGSGAAGGPQAFTQKTYSQMYKLAAEVSGATGIKYADEVLQPSKKEPLVMAGPKSEEAVPLAKATQLYQAVKGTNDSSRYYCVAARPSLKIALRWQPPQVSIRIEGSALKEKAVQSYLEESGFKVSSHKGYASLHVSCDSDALVRKTVGGVILLLGHSWKTALPDLMELKGKGA